MKVADLMQDLEKGDRTMVHLTGKTPEGGISRGMSDLVDSFGMGLGNFWHQYSNSIRLDGPNQMALRQQVNTQAQQNQANQAFLGNTVGSLTGGSLWNR